METLEELEVGKWYQDSSWYSKKDYAKFKKVEIGGVWNKLWYSENILSGSYTKRDDFWGFKLPNLREVPLEEIQEFLPDGHPDKIVKKSLVGRYVKCLRDFANSCSINGKGVKKGEYYQIGCIDGNQYKLKDGNHCGYVFTPDSQFKGIGFELMPEGFTPTKELTELPEKWMVKVTQENATILGEFYGKHCYDRYKIIVPNEYVGKYLSSHNLASGNSMFSKDPGSNYTSTTVLPKYMEISFEQFEKWILKKDSLKIEDKLPTNWYFKVTDENYKKFKDIRPLSDVYGYISSYPVCDLSWGLIYSYPPSNYTEISFEAFEKHVLSKEKTKTSISKTTKEAWVPKVGDFVWDTINKKCLRIKNVTSEDYFILEGQGATYKSQCRKAEPWEIHIEEHITSISTIDVPNGRFYVSSQRDPYDHFNYRYAGDPRNSIQQIRDKYYTIGVDPIEDPVVRFAEYPLTPKESFKTNKLPTKSWY